MNLVTVSGTPSCGKTSVIIKTIHYLTSKQKTAGVVKFDCLSAKDELLKNSDKIILISTHDPLIALSAAKRIIIKNGAMEKVIITSNEERRCLPELKAADDKINGIKLKLRCGDSIIY